MGKGYEQKVRTSRNPVARKHEKMLNCITGNQGKVS